MKKNVRQTDKQQNKRLAALEKKVATVTKRQNPPKRPKKGKKKRLPRVLSSSLTKLGPVLSSMNPPPASISVAGHGRATQNGSTAEDLIFIGTGKPFADGDGSQNNPYQPAGGLILRFNATTGAILTPLMLQDMTQAVSADMLNHGEDSVKYNSCRFSLKYNGSHAFRMGTAFSLVAPHRDNTEDIELALENLLTSPSIANLDAFRSLMGSRKYVRMYNFNNTTHIEENVPCANEWVPFTADRDMCWSYDNDHPNQRINFQQTTTHYSIPADAYILYIPAPVSGTTVVPSYTFGFHSIVELHAARHPGLMTPAKPPSAQVTNALHSLRRVIHETAIHHDVPQHAALQKKPGPWRSLVQFATQPAVKKAGMDALIAGISML